MKDPWTGSQVCKGQLKCTELGIIKHAPFSGARESV
jgi:hypothetical protein